MRRRGVAELSDGLHGEQFSKNGWITRFGKYPESIEPALKRDGDRQNSSLQFEQTFFGRLGNSITALRTLGTACASWIEAIVLYSNSSNMRNYAGDFEVHLTVAAENAAGLVAFREWCVEREMKCVQIVLARGKYAEQPMATWRRAATVLPDVVDASHKFAAELDRQGFQVVRVKVEATPFNEEVPAQDIEAAEHAPQNYFEHHIKLLRAIHAEKATLTDVCEQHAAHLSRNALREPAEGKEERFVTQRAYGTGRETSQEQLDVLLARLDELGEQILECESEYCVYDSNLQLDAGWLPESP